MVTEEEVKAEAVQTATEPKEEAKKPPKKVEIRDITEDGAAKAKELRFTKRFSMVWRTDDGEIREGEFTIKRPTIGETTRIGVLMAEMRQDKPAASLDWATAKTHERIATCTVCVVKAPPWWDPENMFEEEPLIEVYAQVVAYWNSFRKPVG